MKGPCDEHPITDWGTDPFSGEPGTSSSAGGSWGNSSLPDTEAALAVVREATAFYESVIKSGETYTETVVAVTTDVLAALDTLAAELEQRERTAQHNFDHATQMDHRAQRAEAEVTRLHISIEGAMARVVELESRENFLTEQLERQTENAGLLFARLDRAEGLLRALMDYGTYDTADPSPQATAAREYLDER